VFLSDVYVCRNNPVSSVFSCIQNPQSHYIHCGSDEEYSLLGYNLVHTEPSVWGSVSPISGGFLLGLLFDPEDGGNIVL
jgi:hypothetical protein